MSGSSFSEAPSALASRLMLLWNHDPKLLFESRLSVRDESYVVRNINSCSKSVKPSVNL